MALKVIKTITGSEPINIFDAKSWLRVTYDGDNDLINSLITQSRELVETYINQSIIETTIELWSTSRKTLTLPYGPVIEISGITTIDGDDVDYTYNGFEVSFEDTYVDTITTYTAGWGTIPSGLDLVLLQILSFLYENRGDDTEIGNLLYQNKFLQQYRKSIWI